MKIRRTKEDIKWSTQVRQRDGKCRGCGRKPPWKMEAHHIRPRGRWSTRLLLDNGITLCFNCHRKAHETGIKDFVVPIIGQEEFDRLETLSNKLMPKREAIKIFLNNKSQ